MNNHLLKTFFSAYPIIYKAAWKENLLLSFVDIFHGMSFGVVVIITQQFFDRITGYIGGNGEKNVVIWMGVILIAAQILCQILNGFVNFYADVVQEKGYGRICLMMQKKIAKIAPIEFEKNDFLDDLNKADQGADQACTMVDTINSVFTFYVPYFLIMGLYMYRLNYILILAVLLVFVPVLITNYVRLYFGDRIEREIAPIRREAEAYEKTLTSLECYKETRALSAARYFIRLYKSSLKEWNRVAWDKRKKESLVYLGLSVLSFVAYGGILLLLVYLCIIGTISIGSFAVVFASIDVMFYLMEEIFKDSLGNVAKNMGLIHNFLHLINYVEQKQENVTIASNDIIFKNVTFKYPDGENLILDNLSFEINNNEIVAVVGENGAGKTTLSKLILGIYTPNQGEIFIGGERMEQGRNCFGHISGVFQKFMRYKLDLAENITISDYTEKKSYKHALEQVDERLDIDPNVILSRDFDGIDLSGGQWQKIAIARGIHKSCEILLLDEPTAAIDPVQESEMYDKFLKISQEKTSIIITHRLGIARSADRILVMKKGKIVENGKHQELIAKKGEYYRMWNSQAAWYQ